MTINFLPKKKKRCHRANTFFLLLALFLLFGFSISTIIYAEQKKEPVIKQVCFSEFCFEVNIAKTEKQRARGLMYRKSMPADKGMLFVFPTAERHGFWMKNTLIPLDIIWLDSNKQIVSISHNTPPCEINNCPIVKPNSNAMYALEINGGLAKWMGLVEGDEVVFE